MATTEHAKYSATAAQPANQGARDYAITFRVAGPLAAADVVKLCEIPAKTLVRNVIATVVTADTGGATHTFSVAKYNSAGAAESTAGFLLAKDATQAAGTTYKTSDFTLPTNATWAAPNPAMAIHHAGYFAPAVGDSLRFVAVAALTDSVIDVTVLFTDCQ